MTTLDLTLDAHVHSTYSDGRHDPAANLATAVDRGLSHLGLVDHVRRDTTWLPAFVAEVGRIRANSPLAVTCGVEAKILDDRGRVDIPRLPDGIDQIVVADHQVPLGGSCHHPAEIRRLLGSRELRAYEVIGSLVEATARAAERHDDVLIAHLFSVLPKCGLDERDVSDQLVLALGRRLAGAGARVEISERWSCPSVRVARLLAEVGVELVASTDSHRRDTIGIYDYVAEVARALA